LKENLKILHLSAARNWGGGENHIENLCRELKELEPSALNFILCVKNTSFHNKLKGSDFEFQAAPMLIKFDLRYVYKILKLVKKYHIDLIHIHDSTALTLAVMATKLAKLPPFILSKKTSFPIKERPRTLYKYNHPQIQKIFCVSEKTKLITSQSVKDLSKLVTIYHGTATNGVGWSLIFAEVETKGLFNFLIRSEQKVSLTTRIPRESSSLTKFSAMCTGLS